MEQTSRSKSNVKYSRRTQEGKKALYEEWKGSGKSKAQFCKEQKLCLSAFYNWQNHLSPSNKRSNLSPIKVIPQEIAEELRLEQTQVEIIMPTNIIVRVKLPAKNLVNFIQEISYAITIIR